MAKQKKEPVDVSKALTLYQITSELQQITNTIMDAGGECNEETFKALQCWQEELTIKAEKICHVIELKINAPRSYYEKVKAAASAEIEKLDKTEKNLKKYLAHGMADTNTKSIKRDDGLFSISLCDGKASVQITDEGKLPHELVSVVELVKPKTKEIKEALERGENIPGAMLVYGEKYLMIRNAGKKENNDE